MESAAIKKHLTGTGPFVIRTTDGREFATAHRDFVACTPHYVIIEDEKGGMEILDSESVAIIAAGVPPLGFRDHTALLNGYASEDEGLYDDVLPR